MNRFTSRLRTLGSVAALCSLCFVVTACEDELAAPLCDAAHEEFPPNLAGVYAVAGYDESGSFVRAEPTTLTVRITEDKSKGPRALRAEASVSARKNAIPPVTLRALFGGMARACALDGRYFISLMGETGTWRLAELVVHDRGFFLLPQVFRTDELDRRRVPWMLSPRPSLETITGDVRSSADGAQSVSVGSVGSLLIDNRGVSPESLVRLARPGPFVQSFSRVALKDQPAFTLNRTWSALFQKK